MGVTPWLDDGDVRLYHGDCLEVLRELPAGSVHMCATSPPFYGLRDYGGSGTTSLVARNHGRHSIGIELNEEYLTIAATRLQQLSLLA